MLNNALANKNVFDTLNNWSEYPELAPISSKLIIKSFGNGLYTISGATKVLKSVAINDVT
jgi:hypothetical protein